MAKHPRLQPYAELVVLILLLAAALFLRLWRLGQASLQIDNLLFWDILNRDVSSWRILLDWMDLVGITAQLAPVPAAAKLFLEIFRLPPTFFTMLLPFALCGSLTVPAAWMAGREFGGRRLGLMLAALITFSPICIQMSRDAYFYAPTFLGVVLALWAAGLAGRKFGGRDVPRHYHLINATAFLIMTWSSPSGWPFALAYAIFNLTVFTVPAIRERRLTPDLAILLCTYFLIGLPLLLAPWGLQQIHQFTADGKTRAYWTNVFATGRSSSQWVKILPVFNAYAWGTTPVRQLFNTLVFCLGLLHVATIPRHRRTLTILGGIFTAVLIMNILAVEKSVWVFGLTRAVPLLPYYLMLLAAGLLYPATKSANIRGWACTILLGLGGLILWLEPLTLIPQINGFSRPFAAMAAWADVNLPADTPVITDRYFSAYNEYRVHAPEHVQFVSAAPNQIPEQYWDMQFRERVMQFLQNNPTAAFYEEKHLWNRPEVGPWREVRKLFEHQHTITNLAGLRLEQLGLFYRGSPDQRPDLNRFTARIYFNLPEDIVRRASQQGQMATAWLAEGWTTVSTRDFRLWRMLQELAEIEVWNLTTGPLAVRIMLKAVALNGRKHIVLDQQHRGIFEEGKLTEWKTDPIIIQPGRNRLKLKDPQARHTVPLLAASLRIYPAAEH